jgi:menaquinol-cytochrome c reductase iron-sulfur subunit
MNSTSPDRPHETERRSFLARLAAIVIGGVVAIFPFAAGWAVFAHPLRRREEGNNDAPGGDGDLAGFVRICPLESVPADGTPHPFIVSTDVIDAWTHTPKLRVGEVFLTRSDAGGKSTVTALTATCPHLGCTVEFDKTDSHFECPCHESGFAKDGKKLFGPSLRGLDPLDVKLAGDDGGQEVWVRYEAFRAGIAERIPVA